MKKYTCRCGDTRNEGDDKHQHIHELKTFGDFRWLYHLITIECSLCKAKISLESIMEHYDMKRGNDSNWHYFDRTGSFICSGCSHSMDL